MSEPTNEPYRLERKWSNDCEVCPQIWRGNEWVANVVGAPFLGRDSVDRGCDLVRKLNDHDDLLAACEMHQIYAAEVRGAGKSTEERDSAWVIAKSMMIANGWDGLGEPIDFIRRFRDAAIAKARTNA